MKELDTVILTEDLPEHRLQAGDVGTIVLVHPEGAGHEVEFVTLGGETAAVVTLLAAQVRPIAGREIAHVRALAS
jgi:hypothetical protein